MAFSYPTTYRKCKENTKISIAWLCHVALNNGYAVNVGAGANARISTATLVDMAKYLTSRYPEERMPTRIQDALESAIQARTSCSEFYSSMEDPRDKAKAEERVSTEGHKHFISCLREIQSMYRATLDHHTPAKNSARTSRATPARSTPTSDTQVRLKFEGLKVHTCLEDGESSATSAAQTTSSPSGKKRSVVAQIDETPQDDLPMMVWSFFEDLHELEDFLNDIWTRYRDGKLHLCTASAVTNLAIQEVEKAEDDLVGLCQQRGREESDLYIFLSKCLYSDENIKHVGTKGDNFAYYEEYKMLCGKLASTKQGAPYMMKAKTSTASSASATNPSAGTLDRAELYTKLILDLAYANECGKFSDLFEDNSRANSTRSTGFPIRSEQYIDAITKSIDTGTWAKGARRVSSVYAVRIICNINEILGAKVNCYPQLLARGAFAESLLEKDFPVGKDFDYKDHDTVSDLLGPLWGSDRAGLQAAATMDHVQNGVKTNGLGSIKRLRMTTPEHMWDKIHAKKFKKTMEQAHPLWMFPSTDPVFLHSRNPVYNGMELLRLALALEGTGVYQNGQGSAIMAVAYIYQMARQAENGLKQEWKLLEIAMADHQSKMFHGPPPTNESDMLRRLLICSGYPASWFAPNARPATLKKLNGEHVLSSELEIVQQSKISKCLEEYLDGKSTSSRTLQEVHRLNRSNSPSAGEELSTIPLLREFANMLEESLPTIDFNWIKLNRQCAHFMTLLDVNLRLSIKKKYLSTRSGEHTTTESIQFAISIVRDMTNGMLTAAPGHNGETSKILPEMRKKGMGTIVEMFKGFIELQAAEDRAELESGEVKGFTIDSVTESLLPRARTKSAKGKKSKVAK